MSYELVFTDEFKKGVEKLDNAAKERVGKILDKLKETPQLGKPLHGKWDYHRIRFLNSRLTYTIDENAKKVIVLEVGPRDKIYR